MKKKYLFTIIVIVAIAVVLLYDRRTYDEGINPVYDGYGVSFNTYDFSNLKKDGQYYYYEDDKYYSVLGIDVSSFQNGINYNLLKQQGVEFVFIRLGYRGYQSGEIHLDPLFDMHYTKAKEAGLKVGVYFFSAAISNEESIEEANFVLENLIDRDIDLPIVLDIEEIPYDVSRIGTLSNDQIKENINSFFNIINSNGYDTMLYANQNYIKNHLNHKDLSEWGLWYAQYNKLPVYFYEYSIWQYSDAGNFEGYDGNIDLDLMFISKDNN